MKHTVLVSPGSRAGMEPLVAAISRAALRANLAELRARLGPGAAVCAMVKADAYGHGLAGVAAELVRNGAELLAVARLEEAQAVRALGIDAPILLCEPAVAPSSPDGGGDRWLADRLADMCAVRDLHVTLADAAGAAALAQAAERAGTAVPVHVKVDTGMGRGGAMPPDAEAVAGAVAAASSLQLAGLYTHLATAEETGEPGAEFAREQLARFGRIVAQWAERGWRPRYVHAANSAAAVLLSPSAGLTLARPGIALYGYDPDPADPLPCRLTPALELVGRMMFVKNLPAGHAVGYGCTWQTRRPTRLGLVPVGYGDGYRRAFSNRAVMQVAGRDVPVVGRVSMDVTTVDLTDLPDGGRAVRPGDEVTIISPDPAAANSVAALARLADTIPYEITCALGNRVRRQMVDAF